MTNQKNSDLDFLIKLAEVKTLIDDGVFSNDDLMFISDRNLRDYLLDYSRGLD